MMEDFGFLPTGRRRSADRVSFFVITGNTLDESLCGAPAANWGPRHAVESRLRLRQCEHALAMVFLLL